jgi:hypothetical protein
MTKRVSHVQTLEDGLIDAQRESERLEILFLTALRHIVDLEAGIAGPMPEREAREPIVAHTFIGGLWRNPCKQKDSPLQKATKIAVASRCPERFCLAASMSRSTSRSVRYSRLRLPTVTFTEVGAASRSREFSMETALSPVRTVTDSV